MKHLSPQIGGVTATKKSSKGFTLLELLISLLILATISGAVFEQINRMQKRASSEAMKLDQNQQAREFIDQTRSRSAHGWLSRSQHVFRSRRAPLSRGAGIGERFSHANCA